MLDGWSTQKHFAIQEKAVFLSEYIMERFNF